MTFLYPLGLIGLIGIPIVIIIYILRSKYNEKTVTSNYIWHLSDRFLKRRNPLSGLTGIISLILQILTIAAISLALARPVFILKGMAYNYCFVLDASSSMTAEYDGERRFDTAKEKIIDVIKDSKNGSTYSLITVAGTTVTQVDRVTSKDTARELVEGLVPTHTPSEYSDALSAAQSYFDENPSSFIYLLTDKSFDETKNIELIDVSAEREENYAVFDVSYSQTGGKLTATASVISYASDTELSVRLTVDNNPDKSTTSTVAVKAGELTEITLECPTTRFASFDVEVLNSDGYSLDNLITTHNPESEKSYSILIVSETGFFLEASLDALTDSEITVIKPEEYATHAGEYGLYIFDSFEPDKLPNGAVWLINTDRSIPDSGFSVRGKISVGDVDVIEKSKSTSTAIKDMLEGVDNDDIYIRNYVKYSGMYLKFYTLYTYNSYPVIFAGANGLGNRQVVFGFDLHESDIALSSDFVILLRNLLDYSFPDIIDKTDYTVGEDALVNVKTGAENLTAISPSGEEIYLESDGVTATLALNEIGTYTISMTVAGVDESCRIFSAASPAESEPNVMEDAFVIEGERSDEKGDGQFDAMTVLFIILGVLILADWGVYCYEKYQLR